MRRFVFISLLTCALLASAHAQGTAAYAGKVLIQRQFLAGPHPVYDAEGKPLSGEVGPWTTSAEIEVRDVRADGERLLIEGQRLLLLYDPGSKRFRDMFDILRSGSDVARRFFRSRPKEKELQQFRDQQAVTVEIQRAGGWDETAVSAAMKRVFLSPDEYLSDFVPDIWKNLLCAMEKDAGRSLPCPPLPRPGARYVGRGVSAPRARATPDPDYSAAARKARYQGTVTLWLIVSGDGRPERICVVRPLGLGLDEKAVEAVSKWTFEPAKMSDPTNRAAVPVPVQINVEVNFRLY